MSSFVLSGFSSEDGYNDRVTVFESDESFVDVDSATLAARSWLHSNTNGVVEIVEIAGKRGHVRRIVTSAGVEDIG